MVKADSANVHYTIQSFSAIDSSWLHRSVCTFFNLADNKPINKTIEINNDVVHIYDDGDENSDLHSGI